ncbi:MAG TPA: hypothetical protein P5081_24425 [Phycisphaerae bacterium]|nr:hypothetical protein [Phycisphaerae bacterium]HRW56034.1 hypothetical protein [Phycisphaerae bacterium]
MATQTPLRTLLISAFLVFGLNEPGGAQCDPDTILSTLKERIADAKRRGEDYHELEEDYCTLVKQLPESEAAFVKRLGEIRMEAERSGDSSWAGVYGRSRGFTGESIGVGIDAGCVYSQSACLGIHERNNGVLRLTDNGTLRLFFEYSIADFGIVGLVTEWIPVRWGDQRYLIDRERIAKFIYDVRSGSQLPKEDRLFTYRSYFLNMNDRDRPVYGAIEVPEAFVAFLHEVPIYGSMTDIVESIEIAEADNEGRYRWTRVLVDVGEVDGVRECDEFEVLDSETQGALTRLTITQVNETESIGEIQQPILEFWPTPNEPERGWRVASGPWRECDREARSAIDGRLTRQVVAMEE